MRSTFAVCVLAVAACQGPVGPAGTDGRDGVDGISPPPRLPPPLVLPPNVFFVESRTGAIYFENVTLAASATDFAWDVSGLSVGQQLADRWTWTPASSRSATSLTLSTFDPWTAAPLASATTLVSAAAAAAGATSTPKCIFVGDSLTNAGVYTQRLLDLAAGDVMKLELCGSRGAGLNRHEGRGGWTVGTYTSDYSDTSGANPFWIAGRVDFPGYLAANALPAPDWVFVLLGTNDVFWETSDAAAIATARTAFARLDVLIASIQAAGAGVQIGLMTSPPPATDGDLFGAAAGSGQTRWRFKRNILLWDQELVARYRDLEAQRVHLVPTHVNLDTAANMANGVHPTTAGYQQLGDTVWAFLKAHAP